MVLRPRLLRQNPNDYGFVGQAYVDGIMDYEGGAAGLDRDIETGKVKPRTLLIK